MNSDAAGGFMIGFVVGMVLLFLSAVTLIGPTAERQGRREGLEAATPCTTEIQGRVALVGPEKSVFACVQDHRGIMGWRTR